MYIEKKKIYGKTYNYAKISVRSGKSVKTKTIAYLGKDPMTKKQITTKLREISPRTIQKATKELREKLTEKLPSLLSLQQQKVDFIKKDFTKKLKILDQKLYEDMFRDFKTYYIYNTNSIEGNTLTLEETNLLLNQGKTPVGKDLREVYDHINEKETFDYILQAKLDISIKNIIDIHQRLLKNIDKRIGDFRKHNVRVFGATFDTSDAKYVRTDMNLLLRWYKKYRRKLHPLVLATLFHEKFEKIHPFYDGNGRTGRMLVNLILLNAKFPPLIIKNADRQTYYKVLSIAHNADLDKNDPEFYKEIIDFFYQQFVTTYEDIFAKWG